MSRGRLPTVTLVTPSFNQAHFLKKTIKSVLFQEYPELEYIIMDGGSDDGSVEIIESYADRLTHWQSHRDAGQADAILRGWRLGTGKLIGWLNSDDVLLPGALHKIADLYSSGGYDIVTGEELCIDELDFIYRYALKWRGPAWMYRAALLHPGQPGTFYARSMADRVGYFDDHLTCAMEFDLVMKMVQEGATIGYVDSPVAAFRQHGKTKSVLLFDTFQKENRAVFAERASWPFNHTGLREAAVRMMRYPYALRYLNPQQLSETKKKLGWMVTPSRVSWPKTRGASLRR